MIVWMLFLLGNFNTSSQELLHVQQVKSTLQFLLNSSATPPTETVEVTGQTSHEVSFL